MTDTQQKFRFGVLGETVRTAAELAATARRAEALGYATFLLRDHFVAEPFGVQLAPLPALMAAAGATSTLRIGTLVLDNDYRHPVLLAKEAATVDLLSGGRLELGLGAGWLRVEYESAGLPFDAASVRVSRLEEALSVLKGLFAGDPYSFAGEHYTVTELASFPRPAQRPHPPILLGAGSPRMLRLAGREADLVGILAKALPDGTISEDLSERSPQVMARKVEYVREGAGDRFGDVTLSMVISPLIEADHRAAAERYALERGWGRAAAEQVLAMPAAFVGSADRIAEQMRARRDRYGFSYYVVSDREMDAFSPVLERLAGS